MNDKVMVVGPGITLQSAISTCICILQNWSIYPFPSGYFTGIGAMATPVLFYTLQWRHNESDGVSNHQPHDSLLNRVFKAQIKQTSMIRITDLCEWNSPVTCEFPAQRVSNAENVSIGLRHHELLQYQWRNHEWYWANESPWSAGDMC